MIFNELPNCLDVSRVYKLFNGFYYQFTRIQVTQGSFQKKIRVARNLKAKDNKILRSDACNLSKKEILAQVFSCEFCEISKNTIFTEHLRATTSENYLRERLRKVSRDIYLLFPSLRKHFSWLAIMPVFSFLNSILKSHNSIEYRNPQVNCDHKSIFLFNTVSTNTTKWSNTLKQFVGKSRRIVWVCLTILWGWYLKG